MIFACGVRFIRLRSPEVSGCASLSAGAAASMALGVMRLSVFLEVVVLLILLAFSNHGELHAQGVQDGIDRFKAWVCARTKGFV